MHCELLNFTDKFKEYFCSEITVFQPLKIESFPQNYGMLLSVFQINIVEGLIIGWNML